MKRQNAFRCLLIALAILAFGLRPALATGVIPPAVGPCPAGSPCISYAFMGTDPTVGFYTWTVNSSPTLITDTTTFPLTASTPPAGCSIFEVIIANTVPSLPSPPPPPVLHF